MMFQVMKMKNQPKSGKFYLSKIELIINPVRKQKYFLELSLQ